MRGLWVCRRGETCGLVDSCSLEPATRDEQPPSGPDFSNDIPQRVPQMKRVKSHRSPIDSPISVKLCKDPLVHVPKHT